MNNLPLVSIIIPFYNAENYIKEAINSVLNQSYNNIEIILIDDHSTDNSYQVVCSFDSKKVILIKNNSKGASSARNMGIDISKGEYIQFLDADDLLLKDKIELQINALRESKAEVSYTLWGSFCNGSDIKECKIEHNYLLLQSGKDIMKSFGIDRWYVPLNSWLIKRRVIQRAGYWNTSITTNDDGEYLSRVLYWTTRVICVNSIQCLFRIHKGTSLSLIDTKSKAESALKSWILIKDLMKTYPDSKQMLSYPLKGLYIIFIETYKRTPKEGKKIAKAFDLINKETKHIHFHKFKKFSFLINNFGLYYGYKLYRFLNHLKTTLSSCIF